MQDRARSRYGLAERPPLHMSCDNFCTLVLEDICAILLRLFCERSRFFFMALSASPSPWPDACERTQRVSLVQRAERARARRRQLRRRLGRHGMRLLQQRELGTGKQGPPKTRWDGGRHNGRGTVTAPAPFCSARLAVGSSSRPLMSKRPSPSHCVSASPRRSRTSCCSSCRTTRPSRPSPAGARTRREPPPRAETWYSSHGAGERRAAERRAICREFLRVANRNPSGLALVPFFTEGRSA